MRREGNITLTDSQLNWQTIKQRCKHADRQIDNRSARQRAQQRSKLADLLWKRDRQADNQKITGTNLYTYWRQKKPTELREDEHVYRPTYDQYHLFWLCLSNYYHKMLFFWHMLVGLCLLTCILAASSCLRLRYSI